MTDVGGRLVRRIERTPLADGIVEQEGEAVLARAVEPGRPIRRWCCGPRRPPRRPACRCRPATVLRLAKTCPPLPDPWPPVALDAFLALLGAGEPMIPALGGPRPGRPDLRAAARAGSGCARCRSATRSTSTPSTGT